MGSIESRKRFPRERVGFTVETVPPRAEARDYRG